MTRLKHKIDHCVRLSSVLSLILSFACDPDPGDDEEVPSNGVTFDLWKVSRCINKLCLGSSLTKAEFHFWDDYAVEKAQQKDTYIGTLREPDKNQTRRLVLLLAGQNGIGNNVANGVGDWVVGSQDDWQKGWPNTQASEEHTIDPGSVARQFYDYFDDDETFIATSWTHASNFYTSVEEKLDIEDAFYHWLLSKAELGNLDEIVIAGFSRGGCLSLRLGERFNRNLTDYGVDVAIYAVDPVCNVGQSEVGATSTKITNPTNTGYRAVTTDFRSYFPREGHQLYVHNIVSGHKNFGIDNIVGLSNDEATTDPYSFDGWYHQDWIDLVHTAADSYAAGSNRPLAFYEAAQVWFDETCDNPCPYGGGFDGAHCYVGSAPVGTTAFIWNGSYYYSPVGNDWCPLAGSWYDGANCYVQAAPTSEDPFIYQNSWYYSTVWTADTCDAESDPDLDGDGDGVLDADDMCPWTLPGDEVDAEGCSGSLTCNDGTYSPSCTCEGSWQGCCSYHGGVAGCG